VFPSKAGYSGPQPSVPAESRSSILIAEFDPQGFAEESRVGCAFINDEHARFGLHLPAVDGIADPRREAQKVYFVRIVRVKFDGSVSDAHAERLNRSKKTRNIFYLRVMAMFPGHSNLEETSHHVTQAFDAVCVSKPAEPD
jgi:hypothetical protein